jgi:hypothetical protein
VKAAVVAAQREAEHLVAAVASQYFKWQEPRLHR